MGKLSSLYYSRPFEYIKDRLDFHYSAPYFDEIKKIRENFVPFQKFIIDKGIDYGLTASGKEVGAIKFVNTENILEDGNIDDSEIKFVDECPEKLLLKENEILITRSRKIGFCGVITKELENATYGSYIIRFKIMTEKINPFFLAEFINSKLGKEQTDLLKTGSAGENINSEQLCDIRIPDIDIKKQAEILNKINPIKSEIKELKSEKENIMSEVDKKFMHFLSIKEFKEENYSYFFDFDNISEDRLSFGIHHPDLKRLNLSLETSKYKPQPLSHFIELRKESIETKKVAPEESFEYISLANIESHTGRLINVENLLGRDILSKSNVFYKGDLIFGKLRPYLNKAFILEEHDEAIGSAEFFVCKSKGNVILSLLKYYLLTETTLRQTKWILSGSSYPRLDENDFLNLKVVLPDSIKEQEKLLKIIEEGKEKCIKIDKEIFHLKSKAKELFDRMIM